MRKFFFAVAFVFHAFAFSVTVQASSSLVIAAGLDDAQFAALLKRAGGPEFQVIRLEKSVLARAGKLLEEIDKGLIHETGPRSPPSLKAFSAEILAAIPNIFEASEIHVVSEQMLPIELVNDRWGFLGDMASISHEYDVASYTLQVVVDALDSYTIEAVIGMPPGMPRAKQDIVELALSLEQEVPVDIRFNSGLHGLQSSLRRADLSVLHIDTHGSDKGLSIQASRAGDMMKASDLPTSIHPRLVLLFGCEGVAQAELVRIATACARGRGGNLVLRQIHQLRHHRRRGARKAGVRGFFWRLEGGRGRRRGAVALPRGGARRDDGTRVGTLAYPVVFRRCRQWRAEVYLACAGTQLGEAADRSVAHADGSAARVHRSV